jgi:peptide/nickel transport system ATP-binding protein
MALVLQDTSRALNPLLTIERQLTEVLETHEQLERRAARGRALAAPGGKSASPSPSSG